MKLFCKNIWPKYIFSLILHGNINYCSRMRRKITLIAACIALACLANNASATPVMISERGIAEQIEEPAPTLAVDGNIVSVQGASGKTLEVVSLTGKTVATYKIEGPAQRLELNLPKGCYILKVGKVVRKVTVR